MPLFLLGKIVKVCMYVCMYEFTIAVVRTDICSSNSYWCTHIKNSPQNSNSLTWVVQLLGPNLEHMAERIETTLSV